MNERQYWIGFSRVNGIGPVRLRKLLETFGALSEAWKAPPGALEAAGLDQRALASLEEARRRLNLEGELARLDKLGIAVLTWEDEIYPRLLGELIPIDHAPPVLYLRGTLTESDEWAISVVGTRTITPYGRQVTYQMVSELAPHLTIVSGLAAGVDGEAHRAALKAGGRTIAVLPCGLDAVYPPEHRRLAVEIIARGALISPFPPGTLPRKVNFQPRNMVLSGLGRAVLVTEAGEKSGALITAGYALEQGRDVYAVPGNITVHNSNGTNRLIQDGAHPVLSAGDILDLMEVDRITAFVQARRALPDLTGPEKAVYSCLSHDPQHIDEIVQCCKLPVHEVSSTMTLLQLKGLAREVDTMTYVKA
jgi:DNA processing protein